MNWQSWKYWRIKSIECLNCKGIQCERVRDFNPIDLKQIFNPNRSECIRGWNDLDWKFVLNKSEPGFKIWFGFIRIYAYRIEREWIGLSRIDFPGYPWKKYRIEILFEGIRAIPESVSELFRVILYQSEKWS